MAGCSDRLDVEREVREPEMTLEFLVSQQEDRVPFIGMWKAEGGAGLEVEQTWCSPALH